MVAVHHPACPPPPARANWYPGACLHCRRWIETNEGVLVDYLGELIPAHGASRQACPPPEQRTHVEERADHAEGQQSTPSRTDTHPDPCQRCEQVIPAGEGQLHDHGIRHPGDCPPYADGYTGPTWIIDYGMPGPKTPRPVHGYQIGETLRATLYETEHPVPVETPGHRRSGERQVSAIVTVLAEYTPVYSWDEDGTPLHRATR